MWRRTSWQYCCASKAEASSANTVHLEVPVFRLIIIVVPVVVGVIHGEAPAKDLQLATIKDCAGSGSQQLLGSEHTVSLFFSFVSSSLSLLRPDSCESLEHSIVHLCSIALQKGWSEPPSLLPELQISRFLCRAVSDRVPRFHRVSLQCMFADSFMGWTTLAKPAPETTATP